MLQREKKEKRSYLWKKRLVVNQQQNRFSKSKPQKKKKNKNKKLWTQILENRERNPKTNIFMENPKIWNENESKPRSNLNLSNKKTKKKKKGNILYLNLKKWRKTYWSQFQQSDGGRYNGVDTHRFFFLYVLVAVL